jgi:hypothetical protein
MTIVDKNILGFYIPETAIDAVCNLLEQHPLRLNIVRPRKRIHGSYRKPKTKTDYHLITINNDLNPYAFLMTLLHEIAHLQASVKYKSSGHDDRWKYCFTLLLRQFIDLNIFPEDIQYAVLKHIQNMKSSDFLDVFLTKTLQKYDKANSTSPNLVHLEDIPDRTIFQFGNKKMEKQTLIRKYYMCKDLETNKLYRCHPLMKVSVIQNNTK